MTGVVLVAFLFAIYLPHALIKLIAERYVDLGRRRDGSQFDELVAPIFPSAILHFQAFLLIQALCVLGNLASPGAPFRFPGVDWPLLLTAGDAGGAARIARVLDDSYRVMWAIAYGYVLTVVVCVNGIAFGRGALLGIYARAGEDMHPGAGAVAAPESRYQALKLLVSANAFRFWKLFYWDYFVPMFPLAALKPFVFVKTRDGSLFHGRFESFDKTRDGQIDTITLRKASRFTRRPIREALQAGEHPLRPLKGSLMLKWCEIADLNTTVPGEIEALWKRYDKLRVKWKDPEV